MKIRLLKIIQSLRTGGAEMLLRNMLLHGFGDDYEVEVCSLMGPDKTFIEKEIERVGVTVHYLGMKTYLDPSLPFSLHSVISKFRPHVVHTHLNVLLFVCLPAFVARVPAKVHTVHSFAPLESKVLFRLVSRVSFKLLKFTPVGISETIARSVEEYYGLDDVPIINNGIPTDRYDPAPGVREQARSALSLGAEEFVFVHVGRFSPPKNHALLVDAFAHALGRRSDLRLLLVGNGPLRLDVEQRVLELGIAESVLFLGRREDIPSILAASDAFVFSSDYEGLPISLIEAEAAGLPVVATKVGGIVDLVKDGEAGFLVQKSNATSLAESILRVASDREAACLMGRRAREFVRENFEISKTIELHKALYARLLGRPSTERHSHV